MKARRRAAAEPEPLHVPLASSLSPAAASEAAASVLQTLLFLRAQLPGMYADIRDSVAPASDGEAAGAEGDREPCTLAQRRKRPAAPDRRARKLVHDVEALSALLCPALFDGGGVEARSYRVVSEQTSAGFGVHAPRCADARCLRLRRRRWCCCWVPRRHVRVRPMRCDCMLTQRRAAAAPRLHPMRTAPQRLRRRRRQLRARAAPTPRDASRALSCARWPWRGRRPAVRRRWRFSRLHRLL